MKTIIKCVNVLIFEYAIKLHVLNRTVLKSPCDKISRMLKYTVIRRRALKSHRIALMIANLRNQDVNQNEQETNKMKFWELKEEPENREMRTGSVEYLK